MPLPSNNDHCFTRYETSPIVYGSATKTSEQPPRSQCRAAAATDGHAVCVVNELAVAESSFSVMPAAGRRSRRSGRDRRRPCSQLLCTCDPAVTSGSGSGVILIATHVSPLGMNTVLNVGAGGPPTMSVPTRDQSGSRFALTHVGLQVGDEGRRSSTGDRPRSTQPHERTGRELHLRHEEVMVDRRDSSSGPRCSRHDRRGEGDLLRTPAWVNTARAVWPVLESRFACGGVHVKKL